MTYLIGDLCSGAGLAADGYASVFGPDAMHGYDINPQPAYPYWFRQMDAMALLSGGSIVRPELNRYHALHTSFPCQIHTTAGHLRTAQGGTSKYPDLLTPGIDLLRRHWSHKPWVVENVDDRSGNVRKIMAPRSGEDLIVLCGTMFGLPIWRHRLFLANFPLTRPEPTGPGKYGGQGCLHDTCPPDPITGNPRPWGVYHVKGDSVPSGGRTCLTTEHAQEVMGVERDLPWDSLKEGFPPAYTRWIARDLLNHLETR